MNLSTARSEKRAKEVGLRKTVGSARSQLISQFFSESFIVVIFAFVVALLMVNLALPWFNDLAGKQISMPYSAPLFWQASFGFIVVTSLLAGSYPALFLSSFQPVKVLKGCLYAAGCFSSLPRKVLVVTQFTVSVVLIICTLVVYRQIEFGKDRPTGYTRERLVTLKMKSADFYGKYDMLREELKKTGAVEEMSQSMGRVTEVASGNGGFEWKGKDPDMEDSFATLAVTHEHGKTIGWQFVQGRDFSRDYASDSSGMVINETAARYMGLEHPVGEPVTWKWWRNEKVLEYKIIGVIRDMVMESPYAPIEPSVFYIKGHNGSVNWINIRLSTHVSASEALSRIEPVFRKLIPSAPFDYKFVDEEYARKFAFEERIGKLATVFATLAILISCLGLFGLASFVAERRTKEIGIRKILGASVINIWRMLSRDFVVLVVISCFIAIPLSYFFMNQWLQKYEYRTDVAWYVLASAGFGALFITLITVSFQAVRAAIANPVNSLRSE
jgi:ABC-type lipoprotein release transport system permease subunit